MERPSNWTDLALCAEVDINIMFDKDVAVQKIAKDLCRRCEVSSECLSEAILTNDNEYGIRGGLTPNERKRLIKKVMEE